MSTPIKLNNKGFTLIELLVVIAIIGILSSVVLASLNAARQKGKVAAIKADISNAQAQAAIYYDTHGNFNQLCTDSDGIASTVAALESLAGGPSNV